MFLVCKGKIVSIEWLNLVQRLSIGDYFEIHLLHWGLCDPPLSRDQSFFLHEAELRHSAFCKEPLLTWFALQFRSFGKWISILCFLAATLAGRSESESGEMFAAAGISVFFEIICKLLQPLWKISQAVSRCLFGVLICTLVLGFYLVDRTSLPIPLRRVVHFLDSKKFLMSPAGTM